MKIKNILIPIDYSERSGATMSYAVSLAKEYDAKLHLVHVYEPPIAYTDGGFAATVLPPADVIDVEAERDRLTAAIPSGDLAVQTQFVIGNPSEELVDYAKAQNVDLIVMGTHGRTGLTRLLMGSVAEGVLRHASCPVLTVKQPTESSKSSN